MCPAVALVASARHALVLISVTGYRRSLDSTLPSRKSARSSASRYHRRSSALRGAIVAGGRLLEWHDAQRSANTTLPRSIMAALLAR
jgi:hypothetical protein